jgi:hypothetical protein
MKFRRAFRIGYSGAEIPMLAPPQIPAVRRSARWVADQSEQCRASQNPESRQIVTAHGRQLRDRGRHFYLR